MKYFKNISNKKQIGENIEKPVNMTTTTLSYFFVCDILSRNERGIFLWEKLIVFPGAQ